MRIPACKLACSMALAAAVAGCGHAITDEKEPGSFALALPEAERAHGREAELGIALSGGGVRSALFSLGVLKALYDQQLVQEADFISTVSGGGYIGYWLYSNELSNPGQPGTFGRQSLDDDVFSRQFCPIVTSKFVTNYDYLVRGPLKTYPAMYEGEIVKTFGASDPAPGRAMNQLGAPGRVPYLIVNATLREPQAQRGWADGLFELTPLFAGNEHFRYTAWQQDALPYRRAVAASGAAIAGLLNQDMPAPGEQYRQSGISLSDGGHSENLAAIALIRRGVKRIVIVDAEHDPHYGFSGYANLRDRLAKWQLTLAVDAIDSHLINGADPAHSVHGVMTGSVRDAANLETSKIIYVKMAMAESLRKYTDNQALKERGSRIDAGYVKQLEDTAVNGTWQCAQAPVVAQADMQAWFAHVLSGYAQFAEDSWMYRAMRRLGMYSTFPHYSTNDQSYYRDQALAYVGLGYFLGQDVKPYSAFLKGQSAWQPDPVPGSAAQQGAE